MIASRIAGTGMYVPPDLYTNDDLSKIMETSDEWIQKRTGIKQRYWCKPEDSPSGLALEASKKAIDNAGIKKEDIDLIILGTLTPDHEFPGTACFLQAKLGISEVPALDIRQQCTGFIYGMSLADSMIRTGQYKNVLVVGTETHSKGLDRTTRGRDVAVLFGDGAGAAVMQATEVTDPATDSYVMSTHLHADGSFAKELWIQSPGSANGYDERLVPEMMEDKTYYPAMNGKTVFVHATKRMCESVFEACKANGKTPEDVDLYLFHQANLRINEMVAKQLKIPGEKVFNTIQKYANTTAATIPIGMDEAVRAGKLKKGMLVCVSAFGSGFTWASGLLRW